MPKRNATGETEADLRRQLAAVEAKLAAIQAKKTPDKKEAPKKKRAAGVDETVMMAKKKQKIAAATPMEIVDELVAIEKLPYGAQQDEAKLSRPEWFEFADNSMRGHIEVRKKANKLLHGTPGLTKTKLCEACGISGIGPLNKFLDNKYRDAQNSAMESLCDLINILEAATWGVVKRWRNLQCMLKHGTGNGNLGQRHAWSPDKLERFRQAFPDIELEYGDKWWQVAK